MASLTQMNGVLLKSNRLSGPVPEAAAALAQLERLILSGNKLQGKRKEAKRCELFFPLQSPPGRKSPKNGKKLQNPEKLQKMYFRSIFCNFSVIFPHFRGLDQGGGIL